MNRSDGLRTQDAEEFARLLQLALESREIRRLLRPVAAVIDAEQLRVRALRELGSIAAAAAAEHRAFLRAATTAQARTEVHPGPDDASADPEPERGGLLAVLAVLTPVLAAMAAVLFLLIGCALQLVGFHPHLARALRNSGWMFTGLAALSALPGLAALLITAARNRPAAQAGPAPDPEAARAYDLWRRALLERGILPHLREHIAAARHTSDPEPPPTTTG